MATLNDLVRDVALVAPSAAAPIIAEQLRLAADEFCERTRCWTMFLDPIDVEEGEVLYPLSMHANAVPIEVASLSLNGKTLDPDQLPGIFNRDDYLDGLESGIPDKFYQVDATAVALNKLPAMEGEAWTLMAAVYARPSPATLIVPDWLMRDQRSTFIAGGKAKILTLPAWYNERLAAIEQGKFERAVSKMAWRASKGFVKRQEGTNPSYF